MTIALPHWRLLAYDVRERSRLQRAHRQLQRQALFVQESVALTLLPTPDLAALLESTARLLAPADDLRAYTLADLRGIRWLGRGLPDALRCSVGADGTQSIRPARA